MSLATRPTLAVLAALVALATPARAARAQTPTIGSTTPFTLSGCGTVSCHTIWGYVETIVVPQNLAGYGQHSLYVLGQTHAFHGPGYVLEQATSSVIFVTAPGISPSTIFGLETPFTEFADGCGFQPAGSTCTVGTRSSVVTRGGGALPLGLTPTRAAVGIVRLPDDFVAPRGVELTMRPEVPGQTYEYVTLALVTPEPSTAVLVGTALAGLAIAGGTRRARRGAGTRGG